MLTTRLLPPTVVSLPPTTWHLTTSLPPPPPPLDMSTQIALWLAATFVAAILLFAALEWVREGLAFWRAWRGNRRHWRSLRHESRRRGDAYRVIAAPATGEGDEEEGEPDQTTPDDPLSGWRDPW